MMVIKNHSYGQTVKDSLFEIYSTFIYFESNQHYLDEDEKNHLIKLVDSFPNIQNRQYFLESRTDADGSVSFNKILSEKRNNATFAFLKKIGIDSSQIQKVAYGKLKPISDNITEDGKRRNRSTKVSVRQVTKFTKIIGRVSMPLESKIQPLVKVVGKSFKDSIKSDINGHFEFSLPLGQKYTISAVADSLYGEPIGISTISKDIGSSPIILSMFSTKSNSVLLLKKINFIPDKTDLLPESNPSVKYLLEYMSKNKNICFEIIGHINQPGTPIVSGQKFLLSQNRAKKIYDILLRAKIDPKRMKWKGMSNFQMIFPTPKNPFEEQENRRVEILIKDCKS